MKIFLRSSSAFILAGSIVGLLTAQSAQAAVWNGGGADDFWTTSLNWGGLPPTPGEALFFGGTSRLTPLNDSTPDTNFSNITFNSTAGAFTIGGTRIVLEGDVTNNSTAQETINLDMLFASTRIFNTASGDLSVGGTLSGAGGLTKTGNGTLTLSAANSFTGALTVAAGTLSVSTWNSDSTNGSLGNSATPVTLGGAITMGTLRFTGGGSNFAPATIRALNLAAGGGKVQMVYTGGDRNANYVHINGNRITGSGGVTVDTFAGGATSRFIVIGSAAYTGATVVAANSELQTNYNDTVNDGTPFGAGLNGLGSAVTVQSGGRLTFFSFDTSATVALGSLAGSGIVQGEGGGTHTFKIGGDNSSTTFSGVLQNNGGPVAITKVGNGTLTLTGANTNTGIVRIKSGTVAVGNWNTSGAAGPWGAGTTLIELNDGRINYTGPTAAGALRGVNLLSGNNTIDVLAGATLNFAGGSNTFQSNGGNLIKEGGGTLQIGTFGVANNIFAGTVTINAGAVDWFGAGSMPEPAALVADFITINNGAKFQLTYPDFPTTVSANIGFKVSGNAGIVTVGSHTIAGVIADGASAGGITKTGNGIFGLTGANTFTGLVTINSGAISTGSWNLSGQAGTWGIGTNNPAAPATTFIQMTGGRINYTGPSAGGPLRGVNLVSGNNTIDVIAGSTLSFEGGSNTFQSNGGNLIKEGGGTLQLGNYNIANNIFAGRVTINAGTLDWFGAGSMPVPISRVADFITINNGATFQLSYPDFPTRVSANVGFKVSGSAGLAITGSHTIAGVIGDGTSAGGITKTGSGTLILSGANTYTGTTTVDAGTLVFAKSQTLTSLVINNGGIAELSGTGARSGVSVGTSKLIRTLDYSDTFTLGTGMRTTLPANTYPIGTSGFAAALAVENSYGNPARTWTDAKWSISNDANVVNGGLLYPGSSGAGSATGMTQTGGGETNFGIEYDLRNDFIVQFDAVQVADRVNIAIGNSRDTIFSGNGLSVFFRQNDSALPEIGLYNSGIGETNTGFDTGLADVDLDEWHNYAVRFNLPASQLTFWLDEIQLGILDLATFNGGAYLSAINDATNDTISVGNTGGDRIWTDNFQVGGAVATGPTFAAVPEPGSAALLLFGAAIFGLRRRR